MDDSVQSTDIALIGGTGFIGSRLAAGFIECGRKVISIGLHEKPGHPSQVLVADARDQEAFQRVFPKADTVFILTGQNHRDFNLEAELASLVTVVAILNEKRPKKVFYLSSALVYGETSAPAGEDDEPRPVEPYSQFKARAEALLREQLDPSIALGILRLGNVYGAPENRGFIHWVMQSAIVHPTSSELVLNGDGMQTRDYVFIDDVVAALVALEEQLTETDTINIATGKSYTLWEVVDLAGNVASRAIPFTLNQAAIAEVRESHISAEKLADRYNVKLDHDLVSGLRLTADRYRLAALNVL